MTPLQHSEPDPGEHAPAAALIGFMLSEDGATLFHDKGLWTQALEQERSAPFNDRPFDHIVRALPRHIAC